MADETLKDLIRSLKYDPVAAKVGDSIDVYQLEREILYYVCEGHSDASIANKIGSNKAKSSVYNLRRELTRYFARSGYTLDDVTPVILELIPVENGNPQFDKLQDPPPDESEPPPQSEAVDEESTDDPEVPAVVPTTTPPPDEPEPTPQDPPGTPVVIDRGYHQIPRLIWTIIGLLAVAVLASMLGNLNLWQRLRSQLPPIVTREVQVTRVVESIVEVTVPVEMTRIVEVTEEVPVLRTVVIPQTVQVEVPVTVEVTPEPTPLPTITPLPVDVDVTEDFSDFTLDPVFEVVSGEPQFADGRMYVPSQVLLKVGDETWRNYSLSFDALSLSGALSGAATSTVMYMTVRDSRSSKLRFSHGNISWWSGAWSYLGSNGDFVGLVDTDVNWTGHTEVVVEDNFIYHTDESGVTKTIPNTYAESGGFTLTLNHLWIDNLRVERND